MGPIRRRRAAVSNISSWLGTLTMTGQLPSASVARVRPAEKRLCTEVPPPLQSPSSAPNRKSECDIRPGASTRPPATGPKVCRVMRKVSAHERWWRRKPLGSPVLPEVKPM